MGVSLKQPAFSGGIVSPQTLGRTDQQKYATGLRTCSNAWITRYGTVENRPGTVFCGEVKDSSATLRLVPFIFSSGNSYLLEVGNDYFRPWKDGAHVAPGDGGTPVPAWSNATTYAQGDFSTSGGVTYRSLQSTNLNHNPAGSPTWWEAQPTGIVNVATAIPQASLSAMQYVQQNDIMTLAQQGIVPQQFLRFSDSKWQQQAFTPLSGPILTPGSFLVTAGVAAAGYATTSIDELYATGGNASLPPDSYAVYAATGGSASGPSFPASAQGGVDGTHSVVLNWNTYTGVTTYHIFRRVGTQYQEIGTTAAGTTTFTDTNLTPNPATVLPGIAASAAQSMYAYVVTAVNDSTGYESLPSLVANCIAGTPTSANPNTMSWAYKYGYSRYNVYRLANGVFGYIGSQTLPGSNFTGVGPVTGAPLLTFIDNDIIPNTAIQPPASYTLFATSDDYPAVVGFYQQRVAFANTINKPQTVTASRPGDAYNFMANVPVSDSDAVQFTISGKQVQTVRALVDLGKLIIHTNDAEYVAQGNQFGALTPVSASSLSAQGSAGCGTVPPVVIGNTDLFVQNAATRLNDLRYEVQSFAYTGKDLTKFAADLFKGRTIVDMAWQKLPHSIVWCVLDNGSMVGLTYAREDEMWAWHTHATTNGAFENVAVVTEGTEYVVYVVVRRVINGSTVRYIERLASRECVDTVFFSDSVFCDASLTYDGRDWISQASPTTVTATSSGGWASTDTITLTAGASRFTSQDVGDAVVFQKIDATTGLVTDFVTFTILAYTSATVVTGRAQRAVPTWAQATPVSTWGKAARTFTGMGHLENQQIAVLADGSVAANPLDAQYPVITVGGGRFDLPEPALVVTAGLPVQMDVQTLPAENATGETISNKTVKVAECCPTFYSSRGGMFGQDSGHLKTWKQPKTSAMGYPTNPYTGPARIPIQGSPQITGQVYVRNIDPLPFSMSAIVMTGEVGN